MPNVSHLDGLYKQDGHYLKKLTGTGPDLILAERANITKGKPTKFLLSIDSQGNRQYLSSLFKTDTGYRFDHDGVSYVMDATSSDTYTVTVKDAHHV